MTSEETTFTHPLDAFLPAEPANDNGGIAAPWQTPAELVQWVRLDRARLAAELAADPQLWADAEHRLDRMIILAMQRCALWHYYGER